MLADEDSMVPPRSPRRSAATTDDEARPLGKHSGGSRWSKAQVVEQAPEPPCNYETALKEEAARWRREAATLRKENERMAKRVAAADALSTKVDALIGHFEKNEEEQAERIIELEREAAAERRESQQELAEARARVKSLESQLRELEEQLSQATGGDSTSARAAGMSAKAANNASWSAPVIPVRVAPLQPEAVDASAGDMIAWQWARLSVALASAAHWQGLAAKRHKHHSRTRHKRPSEMLLRSPRVEKS